MELFLWIYFTPAALYLSGLIIWMFIGDASDGQILMEVFIAPIFAGLWPLILPAHIWLIRRERKRQNGESTASRAA